MNESSEKWLRRKFLFQKNNNPIYSQPIKCLFLDLWKANSNSKQTDKALLVVYNADNNEFSYSLGEFTRVSKAGVLALPYSEVVDRLWFYLFFQSATNANDVSTSKLVGTVILA